MCAFILRCGDGARRSVGQRLAILALSLPFLLFASSLARSAEPADPLPLSRVVMFTSGVGFFEHAGEIDGDQQV